MGKVFRLLQHSRDEKKALLHLIEQDHLTSVLSINNWLKGLDQQKKLQGIVDYCKVIRDKGPLPYIEFAVKGESISEALIITAMLLPPLALLGLGYTYWYGSTHDGNGGNDVVYFHPITKDFLGDTIEKACECLYNLGQQHLDDQNFVLAEREFNLACLASSNQNERYQITLHAVRDRLKSIIEDSATTIASEDGDHLSARRYSNASSSNLFTPRSYDIYDEEIKENDEELLSEMSRHSALSGSAWGMNSSHHSHL